MIRNIYDDVKRSFKSLKWYEYLMIAIMIIIASQAVFIAYSNPEISKNPLWLTWINFISAICGVMCIFFCAKASIANFVFATINTIVYAIYLWYWKIYGTFWLETLYYLPINFISWYYWIKYRDSLYSEKTLTRTLRWWQQLAIYIIVVLSAVIYHYFLVLYGGNVAWLDAFTVSIGLIAVILEMKRYSEQYILWLITDFISVAMYIIHFDSVYLTKRIIYTIVAFIGYYNWKKLNRERNENNI